MLVAKSVNQLQLIVASLEGSASEGSRCYKVNNSNSNVVKRKRVMPEGIFDEL